MGLRIGGWLGNTWQRNRGAITRTAGAIAGTVVGAAMGNPVAGFGIGSSLGHAAANRAQPSGGGAAPPNANQVEQDDLARRRREALDELERRSRAGPRPLTNDPAAGIQYDRPTAGPRNTDLSERAIAMQRPSSTIANDAIDELRGMGQFQYRDRAPAVMANDPLSEIRDFRGQAGGLASGFASGGYAGASGYDGGDYSISAPTVSVGDIDTMDERASVEELMAFDPSESFERYSEGAQGKMKETLAQSNERLTNTAAGGNRLNTGFFDLDAGELGRQISTDYRNDLMTRALETNAQKLQATTSGTQIRADDLAKIRAEYLAAQTSAAELGVTAGIANADNSVKGQIAGMGFREQAADRDANFRLGALRETGNADRLRLDALNNARGYLENDRTRNDDIYDRDREFATGDFERYQDTLSGIGRVQRGDRDFDNNNFDSDRDFLMDADRQRNDYYEDDRDFNQGSWEAENDLRLRGGALARGDREFEQGTSDDAYERYLDFLSGNSDRAQGAANAAAQNASNRSQSRNELWGQIAGAGAGLAGAWLQGRSNGANTSGSVGSTASRSFVNRARPTIEWDALFNRPNA